MLVCIGALTTERGKGGGGGHGMDGRYAPLCETSLRRHARQMDETPHDLAAACSNSRSEPSSGPPKTRSAARCCRSRWPSPVRWTPARCRRLPCRTWCGNLRDAAFNDRAARIAKYVGGVSSEVNEAKLVALAQSLHRPDPNDSPVPWAQFRAAVERPRAAAVFTAHPTFALPPEIGQALAEAACGRPAPSFASHRPSRPTLAEEFTQANAAIARGRDALDRFTAALLTVARTSWPDR